ncbi:MAG: LytR/AlgR family response regulator transcription factor [Oscillospiraceae bacterium]
MLHICICDDDAAARAQLEELVGQYFNNRAFLLTTHSSYTDFLTAKQHLDLLLMDIDLGDGSGIELAKGAKHADSGTCVIFVTAHPEYVEESFEVEPVYFLVKPIRPDSFHRAMDRAMERLAAERQESRLTVTFQNRVSAVALRDISYIEFSVRSATIHAGTGFCEPTRSSPASSSGWTAVFIQCHKSYLVNMDYVIGFQGNALELCGGVEIPVSQSRAKVTRETLLHHLTRGIS